jgi:hypothetical protein
MKVTKSGLSFVAYAGKILGLRAWTDTPRATWAGCREIFLIGRRDNPAAMSIEPRNHRTASE